MQVAFSSNIHVCSGDFEVSCLRLFQVRWSRYNPYYLEPEVRKEVYNIPETDLTAEQRKEQELKAVRPIKAAPASLHSSGFSDPMIRYHGVCACMRNVALPFSSEN